MLQVLLPNNNQTAPKSLPLRKEIYNNKRVIFSTDWSFFVAKLCRVCVGLSMTVGLSPCYRGASSVSLRADRDGLLWINRLPVFERLTASGFASCVAKELSSGCVSGMLSYVSETGSGKQACIIVILGCANSPCRVFDFAFFDNWRDYQVYCLIRHKKIWVLEYISILSDVRYQLCNSSLKKVWRIQKSVFQSCHNFCYHFSLS